MVHLQINWWLSNFNLRIKNKNDPYEIWLSTLLRFIMEIWYKIDDMKIQNEIIDYVEESEKMWEWSNLIWYN